MKRFVDVRNQGIGGNFAWFDTVVDKFETHSDNMDWISWWDFVGDYKGTELERYQGLTPAWAFKNVEPDTKFFDLLP